MKQIEKRIDTYINHILAGKIPTGKITRLAIKRYISDIDHQIEKGLEFNKQAAFRTIRFFDFLRHTQGSQFAGKPFALTDYQLFVLWNLFGWYRADGKRRFRNSYNELARKNGKSEFAAGTGIFMLRKDNEPGAEIYSAATTREQARKVFEQATVMVAKSPKIRDSVVSYRNSLFTDINLDDVANAGNSFKAVSSDAGTLDGLNPHFVIIDEYHAHKNADVFNIFNDAMVSRQNSMMFTITTAGYRKESPCYRYRKTMLDILQGIIDDESQFAIIFTLDDDDDWENEDVWIKANPNLGITPTIENLRKNSLMAKNNPDQLNSFLTKNLNRWTDSVKAFIPDHAWQLCQAKTEVEPGMECYGGLDLSSKNDFTAFDLLFPIGDKLHAVPFFWIPEEVLQNRNNTGDYVNWARNGHIFTTPGNVIDHRRVTADIIELSRKFKIKKLAFDRYQAYMGLVQELMAEGIEMVPMGQGFVSMSAPTKELERMVLSQVLTHDGNPVLRWMNGNVMLQMDAAGNVKMNKAKSHDKIDGMVALVMALGMHMADNLLPESGDLNRIYNERGFLSL